MTKRVLIPLRQHGSIKELIPYLQFVAGPGMEVIFLARSENLYPWWFTYDLGAFGKSANVMPIGTFAATIAQQRQSRLAEEGISTARQILQEKGVSVRLEFCSSSLKRAVRNYRNGDTNIVILLGRRSRYLRRLISCLHRWLLPFGTTDAPRILLLRADRKF